MSNTMEACATIAGIEVEAVIGGALMRVAFVAGTNPASVPELLRALDPGAQFREAFYSRGGSTARATLQAKALVITTESRGDSTFIKITAHADDGDDLSISVPRKKTADFVPSLEGIGKIGEKNLAKLKAGLETKKPVTVILTEPECFTVKFWKAEDNSCYLDSIEV